MEQNANNLAYHIVRWDELYETSDTRKTTYMGWFKKSTKLIGIGIGETLAQPNGLELLGAWSLIQTLACLSEKSERGWLVRGGRALDAADMHSLIPTVGAEKFQAALEWFSRPRIGWLESVPYQATPELSGKLAGDSPETHRKESATPELSGKLSDREREREREERENRERERKPGAGAPPTLEEVLAWAESEHVDAGFARLKFKETRERGGWKVRGKLIDWRERWKRYWEDEDGEKWRSREKKNPAAPSRGGVSIAEMRGATT